MNQQQEQLVEEVRDGLETAREAYEQFVEAWSGIADAVRRLDDFTYRRIDAYPGWNGSRDVGNGQSMAEWMDEIDRMVDAIAEDGDADGQEE